MSGVKLIQRLSNMSFLILLSVDLGHDVCLLTMKPWTPVGLQCAIKGYFLHFTSSDHHLGIILLK